MLSRSGVYALQAALHLAQQPPDTSVSAMQMAKRLDMPPTYLAKVLNRLSQEGLLASRRGSRGGYRLTVAPEDLSVERVVAPFEQFRTPQVCLLGGPCHEEDPCAAHSRRVAWNDARRHLLAQTTVNDLLDPPARQAESLEMARRSRPLKTGS